MEQSKVDRIWVESEEPKKLGQVLVIVPCGQKKIWDKQPELRSTKASEAYIGPLFALNRTYATAFGDTWIILSAKFGFLRPDFEIPGPYNVTFNRTSSDPIRPQALRRQVMEMGLDRYEVVVGLGGSAYRAAVIAAFADLPVQLVFPFAGLPIGKMMRAVKMAISSGEAGY